MAFDPAKHNRSKHPHTGRWMPKGGRTKRDGSSPASPGPVTSAPSFIPKDVPPAASPEKASLPAPAASAETGVAVPIVDHSSDVGEIVSRSVQLTAGIVFDAAEECTATAAEHNHMVKATAAFIRSKGWQAAAGLGLFLMFTAWVMKILQKPKVGEKVRSWFRREEPTPSVEAPTKPQPATPAQPSAAPPDGRRAVPPLAPV
ncbi:MAG TPA: hypothetical protein VEB66_02365 [Opitutaceae bacterium]|nr:hypothetical protein [Opitutaceae bacterium]